MQGQTDATGGREADVEEIYRRLTSSPELLPWQFDVQQRRLLLACMDERAYRQAIFLDQRLDAAGKTRAFWVPLQKLVSDHGQPPGKIRPARFIFHIGHCGSTLLSQLLADSRSILPVREPMSLRTLASAGRLLEQPQSFLSPAQWAEAVATLLPLLTRSYSDSQHALIKATSNCNSLAGALLASHPEHRAILVYVTAETYLASVLRPQSRDALYSFSQDRMLDMWRVAKDKVPPLHSLVPGELGAMNWCASMVEFVKLRADPDQARKLAWLEFDEFLGSQRRGLQSLQAFFEIADPDDGDQATRQAAHLQAYAKDPSLPFSPETRAAELRRSALANAVEIRQGLRWLERLLEAAPALRPLQPFFGHQLRSA